MASFPLNVDAVSDMQDSRRKDAPSVSQSSTSYSSGSSRELGLSSGYSASSMHRYARAIQHTLDTNIDHAPIPSSNAYASQFDINAGDIEPVPEERLASGEASPQLRRPTPSDWSRWKPMIVASYKHKPARLITDSIRSEGFNVTEKMLRERLRQWRVNTKNRRPQPSRIVLSQCHTLNINGRSSMFEYASVPMARPINTSADDFNERSFLYTMDQFMQHAHERTFDFGAGDSIRDALYDLVVALRVVEWDSKADSRIAWAALSRAGHQLNEAGWSRISPENILWIALYLPSWTKATSTLRLDLKYCIRMLIQSKIGHCHPVSRMLETALRGRLSSDSCRRIFALSDAKAFANHTSLQRRESMDRTSLRVYLQALWDPEDFENMEPILTSRTTSDRDEESSRLEESARVHRLMGKYAESEQSYQKAWSAWSGAAGVHVLYDILDGYICLLLGQHRQAEAVHICLQGISAYSKVAVQSDMDPITQALYPERVYHRVKEWQSLYQAHEALNPVIAKLEAMSLEYKEARDIEPPVAGD